MALPSVSARAQIALDQYRPGPVASDGFAIARPQVPAHLAAEVGVQLSYADTPLQLTAPREGNVSVVSRQLVDHLTFALGVRERGALLVSLPVVLLLEGDSAAERAPQAGFGGMGDLGLGARVRLTDSGAWASFAIQAMARLPTARILNADQAYVGERVGSYEGQVLSSLGRGWAQGYGRLGGRFRGRTRVGILEVGQEMTWGLGARAKLGKPVTAYVELFGATSFASTITSPTELLAGLRYQHNGALVGAAGGTGIVGGYGTPVWRAVMSLGFVPSRAELGEELLDADGDGLPDVIDKCPNAPEDFDDRQDEDGCPDDDDKDGVPDADDACPDGPEDLDGFQDDDGCPDPDNDRDGVPDEKDACPRVPALEPDGCSPFVQWDWRRKRIDVKASLQATERVAGLSSEGIRALHTVRLLLALFEDVKKVRWLAVVGREQGLSARHQLLESVQRVDQKGARTHELVICPLGDEPMMQLSLWLAEAAEAPLADGCELVTPGEETP